MNGEGPAVEITQERINRYAEVTRDFNPLHVDDAFARATPFGGVIAHGMLSLNLAWELLLEELGEAALAEVTVEVRFRRPVRPGDRVRARAKAGDGGVEVWIENQAGEPVIAGRATRTPRG